MGLLAAVEGLTVAIFLFRILLVSRVSFLNPNFHILKLQLSSAWTLILSSLILAKIKLSIAITVIFLLFDARIVNNRVLLATGPIPLLSLDRKSVV